MDFKVDLHVHSRMSGDTDSEPEECVLRAIEAGLYGIAFTEHYSYEASGPVEILKEKYKSRLMILRGVEFSTLEGHCLIFGVNTDRLSMKHAPVKEMARVVNEAGGVIIPSHPFRAGSGLGERIRDINGFCAIEGYNGCNIHSFNQLAVELANALSLPYTGGSDAHEPEEVGACFTEFHDKVTEENFIELLKAGNFHGVDTRKISRGVFNIG